ncbi:hypothetical protein [Fusibacter sp. 3D3]|uniref:hypothetical protein n=1 Tax=Fusibacter sp. 3D3 TaxID=1048380 RepID=UPI0008535DED|nr:hypothetical protein [Fusibacter sp. 3D3]
MVEKFSLKRLECRCTVCESRFVSDNSADNELVKLYLENDLNPKWIKMYGERGYLNLIEKLVEEGASKQVTMKTVSILEQKISDILKRKVTFDKGFRICPACSSKEVSIINEYTLESDKIDFLEIEI